LDGAVCPENLGGALNFNTYTGIATAAAKLPVNFSLSFLSNW
jgi:hypothetical protein